MSLCMKKFYFSIKLLKIGLVTVQMSPGDKSLVLAYCVTCILGRGTRFVFKVIQA